MFLWRVAAAVGGLVTIAACGPSPPSASTVEDLCDVAAFQAGNVATGQISADPPINLERILYGLRADPPAPEGSGLMTIIRGRADVEFFRPRPGPVGLEVTYRLAEARTRVFSRLVLRVNGRPAGRIDLEPGERTIRVSLGADLIREGWNRLHIMPRPKEAGGLNGGRLRILRLRFAGAGSYGEQAVVQCVDGLRGEPVLRLPGGGYVDLVTKLPADAVFRASVSATGTGDRADVRASVELWDGAGPAREAWGRVIEGDDTVGEARLDLGSENTPTVRVRLRAEGSGVVEWRAPRIEGRPAPGRTPDRDGRLLPALEEERPDILVLLLDALRADALGAYGGPYPTPTIDGLAAAGTRFAVARSSSPWTGQSVPAILTGLNPSAAGVAHWHSPLAESVPTLADLLLDAGYTTSLWSHHPFYDYTGTLTRGFERVKLLGSGAVQRTPAAGDLVGASDAPFFAFVHLLPPHTPYAPPAPFLGRYSGWYTGDVSVEAEFLNRVSSRRKPAELSDEDRRYIRDRYQENVAFADDRVTAILRDLERVGRLDTALVIVLSDHGEAFLEHGRFLHLSGLYEEFVRVPLVIRWPRGIEGFVPVVKQPVELVDVAPTIADLLGLPPPGRGFQGRPLAAAAWGEALPPRPIFLETRGTSSGAGAPQPVSAVIEGSWKLIRHSVTGQVELYHLGADPGELHDLSASEPMRAAALEQLLNRIEHANASWLGDRTPAAEAIEIDPEDQKELEALGYL